MNNLCYHYEDSSKFRNHRYDLITLNVNPVTRAVGTFRDECITTVIKINKENADLHLFLSGGWESQICLSSFIEAGIKPEVIVLEFPYNLNIFDSHIAKEYCKKYGIIPKIVDIKIENFIKASMLATSRKYQTYSFFQTLIASTAETINENVLIVDKINLRRDISPAKDWCFSISEDSMWHDRFNSLHQGLRKVIGQFFTSNSELLASFLNLPTVIDLVAGNNGKVSFNSSKEKIYRDGEYSGIISETLFPRQNISTKMIAELAKENTFKIENYLGFAPRNLYIEYNELITSLNNGGKSWQFL